MRSFLFALWLKYWVAVLPYMKNEKCVKAHDKLIRRLRARLGN